MKDFLKYLLQEEFNPDNGGAIVIDGIGDVIIPTIKPTIPIINDDSKSTPDPVVTPELEPDTKPNGTSGSIVQIQDENGISDYILNENGDATKDGVIVYTAAQIADSNNEPTSPDNAEDIHKLISNVSGVDLLDENGQPVIFKEGIEGLAEREVYVKNTFYNQGQSEAIDNFFGGNPDIAEMYTYKSKHGSLDGYIKQTDYNSLVIDENTDTQTLRNILTDHYEAMGNDKATIEKLIKLSENDETIKVDALNALEVLKANKIAKDKEAVQQQQQQQLQEQQKINNYYGMTINAKGELVDLGIKDSIYDKIIKTGKIGNILLPKEGLKVEIDGKPTRVTRQDLFAYFYNDVETPNGFKTQAEIDEEARMKNTDQFLIQGIKNITGGDVSSLEETFRNVIRVKDAKKIITMTNGKAVSSKPSENIDEQVRKGTAQIVIR